MRRWLKRIGWFIVLPLLLVSFVVFGQRWYRDDMGRQALQAVLSELDATDPDWRWESLQAKRFRDIPDDQNIHLVVMQLDAAQRTLPRTEPPLSIIAEDSMRSISDHPNRLLHPEDAKVLHWCLEQQKPLFDLIEKARGCREGYYPHRLPPDWISMLLPHVQSFRDALQLLRSQLVLAVQAGDTKTAIDCVREELRLTAFLDQEPTLISQLVQLAGLWIAKSDLERLLGMLECDDASLAILQLDFESALRRDIMLAGLRGERAGMHHLMNNLENGTVDLGKTIVALQQSNAFFGGTPAATGTLALLEHRYKTFKFSPYLTHNHAMMLRTITMTIESMKLPPYARSEALAAIPAPPDEPRWLIARTLVSSMTLESIMEADTRGRAQLATVVVAIACERYRLRHGHWPKQLSDVTGEFLPELPLDPYTGKPLMLRVFDDGIAVYSTYTDRVNNHGELFRGGDGVNKDIGTRLWNVTARRQPAPEKEPELIPVYPGGEPYDSEPMIGDE